MNADDMPEHGHEHGRHGVKHEHEHDMPEAGNRPTQPSHPFAGRGALAYI